MHTISGCYMLVQTATEHEPWLPPRRRYLPQTKTNVHTLISHAAYRTTVQQTFANTNPEPLAAVKYAFPLYDGVSVVSFECRVGERVLAGVVKERRRARADYDAAVAQGQTAGLLEQMPSASDVFVTSLGNVPALATVNVTIQLVGELKHDAGVDGLRLTIPTHIAPRYGAYSDEMFGAEQSSAQDVTDVTVDISLPETWPIQKVQSPSHPLSVSVGSLSTEAALPDATPSLSKASATLAQETAGLDRDIVVQIVARNLGNPQALIEKHPRHPGSSALLATFVPRFSIPPARPEVVFICDRSGSMQFNVPMLKSAMNILLKSLPVGVKFNICSFGSSHSFFAPKSQTYDETSLARALKHVETFAADFGGTETGAAIEAAIQARFGDVPLELILLTDGDIWGAEAVFKRLNDEVQNNVRLFTLGIGHGVSHAAIEGAARAGRGFAQHVADGERMDAKVVRMLKGALSPQIKDYSLSVRMRGFEQELRAERNSRVVLEEVKGATSKPTISLFDPTIDFKAKEAIDASKGSKNRFAHLPKLHPPHIIQAPHNLPSLFPFTRTSVYLLLDGIDADKVENVTFRGTCDHGPLELAIPVAQAEHAQETIHQLAAKKATQDLEEGRGWLHAAHDLSGQLVSKARPSLIEDLVEREAVRIGTVFQVAGKFCSLVAVQGGRRDEEPADLEFEVVEHAEAHAPPPGSSLFASAAPRTRASVARYAAPLPPPAPAPMPCAAPTPSATSSYGGAAPLTASYAAAPSPPVAAHTTNAASAPSAPPSWGGVAYGGVAACTASYAAAPPPPVGAPMTYSTPPSAARSWGGVAFGSAAPYMARQHMLSQHLPASSTQSSLEKKKKSSGAVEVIDAIIAAQGFQGSFSAASVPWAAMDIERAVVDEAAQGADDALITAVVVLYLEQRLAVSRDTWELVVDKARVWLGTRGFAEEGWALARRVVGVE